VVVLAASRWYLREPVTLHRWAGVALIVVGIALVAST
jgi:drug/metabolite transporter (DMT)-like permease